MHTKLFALLLLVSRTIAGKGTKSMVKCDGQIFRQTYFDKYTLFEGLGKPYNLMMHKYTGNLFFSHTIQNGTKIDFGIMSCHVETRNCINIDGVPGGHAIAYDRGNKAVYFGGHNGIYNYNVRKNKLKFFGAKGRSIWGLFIRRNFYYIEYPSQQLYIYNAGKFKQVKEAIGIEIDNFFVTRRFEIYYTNKTGVYKLEKPSKPPKVLSKKIIVSQITQDIYGDLYFCANDGIYIEDRRSEMIMKVADIHQPYGITFVRIVTNRGETNQLIYSDATSIYILLPSEHKDMCYKAITKAQKNSNTTRSTTKNP
ncbi:unnamed protein product [Arctia plantaginis]|uniref:Ommochrome-binding protein-like n=1 Tax=Arctia plantaginis TaxID=874455 RepID=A0A8S0ZFP2_ARCPL|nr:unnamed protein product [Arctia plantaginis]CAB3258568.1 unnamed protein product [Arctia plantaginis]